MSSYLTDYRQHVGVKPDQFYKTTLFRGDFLMLGLNCLEPGQVQPVHDYSGGAHAALQRYCAAKIDDNRLQIRLSRVRSLIGLGMVTAIAVIIIAAAYLLFNSVFSGAPDTVKGIVAASISVFVWVILWDPMESLLFNWVEPRMENSILRKLQGVGIVARPKS